MARGAMVVGEDILIEKALDAIVGWYAKKKEEKQLIHDVLMELKVGFNSVILHMNLSKEHGAIKYSKLRGYLPNDIENLNRILIKYQSKLDNEIYDKLMNFIQFLIEYNELINSLHMGIAKEVEEREKIIKETIEQIISKLTELIKEIEK
jgi:hypothetical protein